MKPAMSCGAEGVAICYNHRDIETAFGRSYRRVNRLGGYNDQLLIESFLSGRQFVVNTVSVAGEHYVTDAWHLNLCPVAGSAFVPKDLHLLDPASPHGVQLIEFTHAVLDALGIQNGAAQTDIKLTRNGPALIGVGAHLMSVSMHRGAHCTAALPTQASVLAESVASGPDIWRGTFGNKHYKLRKHMAKVFFSFDEPGVVRSIAGLARLQRLSSFQAHDRPLAPGDPVSRTADMLGRGGIVHLVHEDREQIAHDMQMIREWESGGELYDVATPDSAEPLLPRALLRNLAEAVSRPKT